MSLFKNTEDQQLGRGRSLTAKDFFKEYNADGYFTRPAFVEFANSLTETEANDFINLIAQLKAGSKLNLKFQLRYDNVGKQYAWIEFLFAKANKGFKLLAAGDVLRLIEEYAVGLIKVGFTAEELSEVALNG